MTVPGLRESKPLDKRALKRVSIDPWHEPKVSAARHRFSQPSFALRGAANTKRERRLNSLCTGVRGWDVRAAGCRAVGRVGSCRAGTSCLGAADGWMGGQADGRAIRLEGCGWAAGGCCLLVAGAG
ncbi:hypothetical protein VFPBJ_07794 [Purpureocillium lilacinum]|uniref:Uncharacterized protein n=1 Tax=Purpureocillium lilacinum TaxID=33203 RepID=A0A179GHL0_PURLI|nr:hypothetical protein VFPBJ_07794 [Purpureocillium lilacinum]